MKGNIKVDLMEAGFYRWIMSYASSPMTPFASSGIAPLSEVFR
jgi:hypothetical protein